MRTASGGPLPEQAPGPKKVLDSSTSFCYTTCMLINEAQKLNLTRKHFTLIAEIIGQVDDKGNREGTAQAYAILFEQTHPRFDRAKFEAYVEEVHADCWSDNGPIFEKGV